jgi:hypothetical protein
MDVTQGEAQAEHLNTKYTRVLTAPTSNSAIHTSDYAPEGHYIDEAQ